VPFIAYVDENAYSKMRLGVLWINALSSIERAGNQTPWNPAELIENVHERLFFAFLSGLLERVDLHRTRLSRDYCRGARGG